MRTVRWIRNGRSEWVRVRQRPEFFLLSFTLFFFVFLLIFINSRVLTWTIVFIWCCWTADWDVHIVQRLRLVFCFGHHRRWGLCGTASGKQFFSLELYADIKFIMQPRSDRSRIWVWVFGMCRVGFDMKMALWWRRYGWVCVCVCGQWTIWRYPVFARALMIVVPIWFRWIATNRKRWHTLTIMFGWAKLTLPMSFGVRIAGRINYLMNIYPVKKRRKQRRGVKVIDTNNHLSMDFWFVLAFADVRSISVSLFVD